MAIGTLKFGDSFPGLLIDGVEDTPYTGATLKMEPRRGVSVEVPFIGGDETGQFTHVAEWFSTQTPPLNMVIATPNGRVGLFGIKWAGHSMRMGVSLGTLTPSETLLGHCEAPLDQPLVVTEALSHLDGLSEWTRFRAIDTETETDDEGLATGVHIHVRSGGNLSWWQGDARMTVRSDWSTENPEDDERNGLNISERSVLISRFRESRPFNDHVVEQRKVAHLLTLLSGKPVLFRRHRVSDNQIVLRSAGGDILARPRVELVSKNTVRDYAQPQPEKSDFSDYLAHLVEVGSEGMTRWATKYDEWRRFVLPAVGVLGRRDAFIEDVIVSTSMSVEAAGHIVGEQPGEAETRNGRRPTTATHVYRCLELLALDFPDLAPSRIAVARAVANAYNDIKHYDRGYFPPVGVSRIASNILRAIVRLLVLHIVADDGSLLTPQKKSGFIRRVHQLSEGYDVAFDENGRAISRTVDEQP